MKLVTKTLALLGAFVAASSCIGCWLFLLDEPEMPESLIK